MSDTDEQDDDRAAQDAAAADDYFRTYLDADGAGW
jgi:hypothetical protein